MLLAGAAVAVAAAATVLWVRAQARRAERDHPPIGRFIEVDGVRLHYVERGEGPPVVLLHGNGTMIQDFELSGLVGIAAERHRVIVFDRPGYGYSERPRGRRLWTPAAQADLLREALRRLGVERPVVVGHSWGTLVALALALRHPAEVRALVLLSGYYFPSLRLDVPLLSPPAIPVLGDVMRYTVSPLVARLIWPLMLRRLFRPAPVPPRFRALFPRGLAMRPSQLRAAAAESALMIPAAMGLRHRYRQLRMPVVIMAGAGDRHVETAKQSARLYREMPGSGFSAVPAIGHMLHHGAPEQVVAAIDLAERRAREAAGVVRSDVAGHRTEARV